MTLKYLTMASAMAALIFVPVAEAHAAGSGGNSFKLDRKSNTKKNTMKNLRSCNRGYVYSKRRKRCVRKNSEVIPDADLIEQGWQLAYADRYEGAIEVFSLVVERDQPAVLNGLGYSHRKLGKLDEGISYYRRAISLNPDYVLAREYLGEGYVAAGMIELAKVQLQEIAERCGVHCSEYGDLARAISQGKENEWR